jgi:hypothetical protein
VDLVTGVDEMTAGVDIVSEGGVALEGALMVDGFSGGCHGSNWPEGTILGLARSQGATCGEVEGSFGSRPRK